MVAPPGRRTPDAPPLAGPDGRRPKIQTPSRPDSAGGAPPRAGTVAALALAAAYALAISWLAVAQHATFHTRARDMGIYAQVLWNTGHGRPFASTLLADNASHLAEHVAPLLALLAPLYALAPDPRWLLVLQQLCLAGAGLPLFFWARQKLGDPIALVLLAGFYAMPAMSRVALSEFHPIVVAALPISLGVKAVLEGRVRPAACWLVLALLIEEETAPIVGAAGAYLLLVQRRRVGLALGGLAASWLVLVVLVLMPAFYDRQTRARAEGTRTAAHFDLVRQDPSVALDWLAGERGTEAAAWLLGPTAGLPLFAPSVLALAVPSFAVLFLQDREGTFAGHWSAAMLPVLWFAAGAGLIRLVGRFRAHRSAALGLAGVALILTGGFSYARFSLYPGGRAFDREHYVRTEQEDDLARAAALVPPNVRLDATRRVVPHLAHRAEVYQFPSTFYSAPMRPDLARIDAFLLDLTDSATRRALDASEQDTVLSKRPRMHTRLFGDDVLLLTRERPAPSHPADAAFGEAIRLTGYELDRRPDGVRLSPTWETIGRPGAWARVAELVGADGRPIARAVAAPLDPYLPPARWDRGQIVVDSIDLSLPAMLPPGPYRITLAWQDGAGQPIPLRDGAEYVEIGPVDLGWGAP